MILIVEGIDRVGKTTLCKRLEKLGFLYLKDAWHVSGELDAHEIPVYSIGKLDTTVEMLKLLNNQGINVVMDRCHLTEWVYGKYSRDNYVRVDLLYKIDRLLADIGCSLAYVYPNDIQKSNEEAGVDQTYHEEYFRILANNTYIKNRYFVSFPEIDSAVARIAKDTFAYDIYFASPFFKPSQVEREEALKDILRSNGLKIFSPKEEIFLSPEASLDERRMVFEGNCKAIRNSMAVFAITDEKDMGTIWEAGYAYGVKRPVIYFAETLGNNQFNLMLAQSGKKVFLDRESVTREALISAIFNDVDDFKGLIE